jgi:outer membrane lipoprotein-sorting protein
MIPISSIKILSSNKRLRSLLVSLGIALIQPLVTGVGWSPARAEESRIFPIVQKMESSFNSVEDYFCEVEQVFYQDGKEDQRYQFKFFYKKNKRIRVNFISPYPGMVIYFKGGDKDATVKPFRGLPSLKFRFSIHNPLIKTAAGQTIDQTDMGYFINFLMKNLKSVKQGEDEFYEDSEQVKFLLLAMDYIEGKNLERYRIGISKKNWLPIRIERYSLDGQPLEVTVIKDYVINVHLEVKFFTP